MVTTANIFFLALGSLLLLSAIIDILWTTLWANAGAGPLSTRLITGAWRGLRTLGDRQSRLLDLAGPIILSLTLAMWVAFIWGGWTFVFAGGENALTDTRDVGPISWAERTYFVAYSMFTMGNGDFTPTDGIWQIATSLTTASGMLFVSLGISYVISVLGAVVDKRSFASTVTGIETRSEAFVRDGWNGEDFHELDLPLDTLASDLGHLAKQHKAYPILHYYHSDEADDASAVAVAIFDDALTTLRFGVPETHRPNTPLLNTARSSTQDYLQTLDSIGIPPAEDTPPPPELDYLREEGIPTVSDEEFASALNDLSERRRKLLGGVIANAWLWPPANNE
jgi:hypothetical protein